MPESSDLFTPSYQPCRLKFDSAGFSPSIQTYSPLPSTAIASGRSPPPGASGAWADGGAAGTWPWGSLAPVPRCPIAPGGFRVPLGVQSKFARHVQSMPPWLAISDVVMTRMVCSPGFSASCPALTHARKRWSIFCGEMLIRWPAVFFRSMATGAAPSRL